MNARALDLRALRLQKRLPQQTVADRLGVSQSYYSNIENGKKPREIREAEKVINRMRTKTDRTDGGAAKVGRQK